MTGIGVTALHSMKTATNQRRRRAMGGIRRWIAGALLMAVAACGPASGAGPMPRSNARVISQVEIEQTPASNLYDLIQRLRPGWMQQRAAAGAYGYPTVYVGSQVLGGIERLREISLSNVREVRYLDPIEATSRFGRTVPFGVIHVTVDIGG
jgi:hypothetical protein